MATGDDLGERVERAVPEPHGAATTAGILVTAVVLGAFVAWMSADVLGRLPGFATGTLATAVGLYSQETTREIVAAACYALAVLVALVPIAYELPILRNTATPLAHLLTTTDLILFLAFLTLASPLAVLGYRIETGPFTPRIRAHFTDD